MWADFGNGAMRASALIVVSILLASCASAPEGDPEAAAEFQKLNDPVEPANRAIFEFNRGADRYVIKPVTAGYRTITTPEMRDGVHNALQNLRSPVIFANDLLQGEFGRAGTTFARFLINSTLGVVGFGDPAADLGFTPHDEDFGQTLAVWGVGEGPYLMLPLLGPSNPRDTAGLALDTLVLDPTNYVHVKQHFWWDAGRQYLNVLDLRSQTFETLQGIERSSVDYYATLRSLYRQARDSDIRNGAPAKAEDLPDF
jgi:phospholipid-binding lipoprotein MlaA